MFVRATIFEQKACDFLQEISVNKCDRDIHACYRLKEKDQTIYQQKNSLRILRVKRQLKRLDPAAVDFPEGTKMFISESLHSYYRE